MLSKFSGLENTYGDTLVEIKNVELLLGQEVLDVVLESLNLSLLFLIVHAAEQALLSGYQQSSLSEDHGSEEHAPLEEGLLQHHF